MNTTLTNRPDLHFVPGTKSPLIDGRHVVFGPDRVVEARLPLKTARGQAWQDVVIRVPGRVVRHRLPFGVEVLDCPRHPSWQAEALRAHGPVCEQCTAAWWDDDPDPDNSGIPEV